MPSSCNSKRLASWSPVYSNSCACGETTTACDEILEANDAVLDAERNVDVNDLDWNSATLNWDWLDWASAMTPDAAAEPVCLEFVPTCNANTKFNTQDHNGIDIIVDIVGEGNASITCTDGQTCVGNARFPVAVVEMTCERGSTCHANAYLGAVNMVCKEGSTCKGGEDGGTVAFQCEKGAVCDSREGSRVKYLPYVENPLGGAQLP